MSTTKKENEKLVVEEELGRLSVLETEINNTLDMLEDVIKVLKDPNSIIKGGSGRLATVVEQKISLLTRKESVIKNQADLKRAVFTTNSKINAEEGSPQAELLKMMSAITDEARRSRDALEKAAKELGSPAIKNMDDVHNFFTDDKELKN